MSRLVAWCARIGSIVSTAALALLIPATAWAATTPGVVALEAVRRRPRYGGGMFFFSSLCCLVVVGVLVLVLLLTLRGRRGGRR